MSGMRTGAPTYAYSMITNSHAGKYVWFCIHLEMNCQMLYTCITFAKILGTIMEN